jgi:nuclear pore complex protein Nup85
MLLAQSETFNQFLQLKFPKTGEQTTAASSRCQPLPDIIHLSLLVILYLPEAGFDDAPVGEELMEWFNTYFIKPSSKKGDHLSTLAVSETEGCLIILFMQICPVRIFKKVSVFLLETLARHPSEHLQSVAQHLAPLLS